MGVSGFICTWVFFFELFLRINMGFVLSEFTLLINICNVLFMSSIRSKHIFKLCPYFLHISLSFCAILYAFWFFCLCINVITSVSFTCTFFILLVFWFSLHASFMFVVEVFEILSLSTLFFVTSIYFMINFSFDQIALDCFWCVVWIISKSFIWKIIISFFKLSFVCIEWKFWRSILLYIVRYFYFCWSFGILFMVQSI